MFKMILEFGKYKGKSVQDVMSFDPAYIGWCIREEIIKVDSETKEKALDAFDKENAIAEAIFESEHDDWGMRD